MDKILMHYGDTLAEQLRKNAQDFSKLSDFDRFVLADGYRYATLEELRAGYDRYWKANHNILITMEEFLAEAEKTPDSPAADTYKALAGLVAEGKLQPGEVIGYARYCRCLNRPEAVIAYQTAPHKWVVNDCEAEISVDLARTKVYKEWGFAPDRVRIIGTPYYDATDWQFIRFDCAYMTWLWKNDSLYQVYD